MMRRLIFLSFILSFVLIGCTDDDNKEISNIEKVILNISYDTDGDSCLLYTSPSPRDCS